MVEDKGALGYKLRPLFFQVVEAHRIGSTRYDVEGTVIWRTLFGIGVGQPYDLDVRRWLAVWTAFVLAQLALAAFVIRKLLAAGVL